jgi:hypothetical protein
VLLVPAAAPAELVEVLFAIVLVLQDGGWCRQCGSTRREARLP